MTWRTISDTEIDSDSPITQTLMFALRDNQEAIAQGLSGSPMVYAGWHPYDAVTVGDGADGVFYDHSVDGAVSSVETPAFADGYEYAIVVNGISTSASTEIRIDFYRETDATYTNDAGGMGAFDSSSTFYGTYHIIFPRRLGYHHNGAWVVPSVELTTGGGSVNLLTSTSAGASDTTLQAISKARVRVSTGNFDAGQLILLRRREYYTG